MHSPADAGAPRIAVIHQELEVIDTLDVAGNIFSGASPRGGRFRLLDRRRMEADAEQQLARIGVRLSPRTPCARCRRRSGSSWPSPAPCR